MFEKLKRKWNVNGVQVLLILCVFAITGTTTAYLSRAIPGWMGLDAESPLAIRLLIRVSILLFGYQVLILLIAIPFGQFRFFWNYEKKILRWFGKRLGIISTQPAVEKKN